MSQDEAVKKQVALEVAKRDLEDIKRLRESDPFRRYFLRRLRERALKAEHSFKYDTLSSENREAARQVMLELEHLEKMMDEDFSSLAETFRTLSDQTLMPGTRGNG